MPPYHEILHRHTDVQTHIKLQDMQQPVRISRERGQVKKTQSQKGANHHNITFVEQPRNDEVIERERRSVIVSDEGRGEGQRKVSL